MSFFEEFKRNATDVANKAVKKTGELTNIARLGINVKTNEAKLSSVFEEIGYMFYEAQSTGADHTSDIASLIMKADKIKADIENTKKEIAKLKKVVICTGCGNEVSEEASFCPHCGAKIEKSEPETCEDDCCCDENECSCGCGCEETETEEETAETCGCGCCCDEETTEETETTEASEECCDTHEDSADNSEDSTNE